MAIHVPSARRDFNITYLHGKQTLRPRRPAGYREICICDYEEQKKETRPKLRRGLPQASRVAGG